ncbi:septal ring lytic transglycosylase RlpA family protein [Streptomyces rhizosphaerihabitans]|uniref:septal ring lytic transglycosylase RlpA family protein n=1 Tax=Streptomyces rhizosphaerihabitans TaxID=1266770 RepID=UPI0021C09688|nr:septal ring lytic transglycosylase RlpA family protein [Streptomyces rhizosphaerihabitans]MCT9010172.1 septal ring lytic transglycosylase RlpA family protein [Streptomyces rhizosphaerihabitans]
MSRRRRTLSTKKKIALLVSAATVAGGGAFALAATSNAASVQTAQTSVACQGLATALGNNQSFIADQKAHPDSQSAARIANREAVIAQIKVQQQASGCAVGESAQGSQTAQQPAQSAPAKTAPAASAPAQTAPANNAGGAAATGQQVCTGSTVTLSGEAGAPAASSNQFPAGTKLKVTNLDNNKSTTVQVTSVSGSCVLLNNAAFEQVREPGKFLIRKARIEKVG